MKFPLFKSTKIKELQKEIKDLENDFEEKFDEHMDYYLANKSLIGSDGANPFSDGFSTVDEQYDKSSLQKLFTTETWFHIAVSTIAQSIAALDFKLEKKKVVKQNVTQGNGESEEIFKEVWIDAGAEPEATIFRFPNEIQTRYDFWYNVVADLLATGDAFIFPMRSNLEESNSEDRLASAISRFRKTDVDALFRINSAMVEIVPSENPGEFIEKILVTSEEDTIEFGPDEIIHAKMPNPADPFYGLAPIVAVLKKLLLDRYSDESMIRFWKQGARLGGVIETSKNLTKEQMTRLTSTFEAKFTGKRQQHKTLILPNGMTYKPIEVSPVNTALIDFSKTNREAIMAVYKVPPIKIGLLDGATYANAMIQNKTFWTNAVMPIVSLLEASINKSELILKPMRNMRFKFDLSNVEALQEDYLAKAQSGEAMLKSGLLVNEVRELLWSLGPIEGGDYSPATKPAPSVNPLMLSAPKEESNQKVSEHHHIDSEGNQTGPAVDAGSGLHDHAQFDADGNVVGRTGAENNEPTHVHTDIYNRLTGGPKGGKQFTAPFSKEALVRYSKIVSGDGVSGLLEERKKEAEAFFKRLEAAIIGKIKRVPFRKTKGFGIKIALPSLEDIEFFINKELENIPESLLKASQHGYKANIPSSSIVFPNDKALNILKKIATRQVTSVTKSSLNQLKNIITSSVSETVSVTELSSRIQDAFKTISAGKANTIARTETLTAVSLGQNLKTSEFKAQFPDAAKNLKRIWITALDDKVRDQHAELEGVVIEVGAEFKVGLKFPRDPDADASEVINCRCSYFDYLPEDSDDTLSVLSSTPAFDGQV